MVLHPAPGRRRLRAPVRDAGAGRLDPRRVASIEYSNEVWNGSFGQARHAVAQARALGLPTPAGFGSIYYAERTRQIVAIVDAVFGARRAQALAHGRRRAGGLDPVRQRRARLEGHRRAVDAYAIAPYFNAAAANDPAKVEATLALTPDAIVEQMRANIRGDVKSHIVDSAKLAARHKLPLLAYESRRERQQLRFPGRPAGRDDRALQRRAPPAAMREVYREYIDTWVAAGGGLLNQYNDIGRWSKWGLWGVLSTSRRTRRARRSTWACSTRSRRIRRGRADGAAALRLRNGSCWFLPDDSAPMPHPRS